MKEHPGLLSPEALEARTYVLSWVPSLYVSAQSSVPRTLLTPSFRPGLWSWLCP